MFVEGEIPALVSGGNGNANGDGFGGWWGIIALIAVAAIFGRNGGLFGGGNNGQGVTQAELCSSLNFNNLDSAVRGIQNGLCDGFYAQNTNILNGFAGVQQTLCQGFGGVNNAITNASYQSQLATNNLGYQLQNCCCDLRTQISDVACQNATNTAAIIQAGSNNTQRIIDYLCNEKIEALRAENQALRFGASQTAQNQFITQVGNDIVSRLNPTPVPAYPVFAPSMSFAYPSGVTFGVNGNCGCNSGCGCGTTIQ